MVTMLLCQYKLENIIIFILGRGLNYHHGNHVMTSILVISKLEYIIIIILGKGLNYHHGNHILMSIIGISELEHIQVIILISKYQNLSKIKIRRGMATVNFVSNKCQTFG